MKTINKPNTYETLENNINTTATVRSHYTIYQKQKFSDSTKKL